MDCGSKEGAHQSEGELMIGTLVVCVMANRCQGQQVAPAELEAHLQAHPSVADCAVIGVFDENAGERPKAFVVKRNSAGKKDAALREELHKHVRDHKTRYKWLSGGIEFLEEIPRSASGKILRRTLRDMEKKKERPTKL